jgi:hypothetical protein
MFPVPATSSIGRSDGEQAPAVLSVTVNCNFDLNSETELNKIEPSLVLSELLTCLSMARKQSNNLKQRQYDKQ